MYPTSTGFGSPGLSVPTTGVNFTVKTPAAAVEFRNAGSNSVLIVANAILTSDGTTPLAFVGVNASQTDTQFRRIQVADMSVIGYLLKAGQSVTFKGYAPNHAGAQLVVFALMALVGTTTLEGGVTDVSSQ